MCVYAIIKARILLVRGDGLYEIDTHRIWTIRRPDCITACISFDLAVYSYKMGKFGKPKPLSPTVSTAIVFGIIVISIIFGFAVLNLLGINPSK